ncbi:Mce-associated membrane protein [Saccharomonospora amisosensis]|uniref:Mce-associated membrane protein n=1 Tax=Saccharomonospora amisosensis TaxID=1128677 RepID=A0A7X5UWB5_9PSEU|nr:hypothetical protein [Saccharomonospora amisosensis]NIJ14893.1 Mce-associated membrane protein [Saccharomonospora amisosensis]
MSVPGGNRWRAALAALAVVAVLACAWFGWSWWSAEHSDFARRADDRDAALQAGTEGLARLYTIDHGTAGSDVDAWINVTEGSLSEEFRKDRRSHIERARERRISSTAQVRHGALSALDIQAGRASMLAVLNVEVATDGGERTNKRSTLLAELRRTEGGWKISSVQAQR